jgi:hypothetical protein
MPSKKTTTKTISDVAKPGKSAPTNTSRPVIITNRPIMKDPMVVTKDAPSDEEKVTVTVNSKSSLKPKLQPLTLPTKEAEPEKVEEQATTTPDEKPAASTKSPVPAPEKAPEPAKVADEEPAKTEQPSSEAAGLPSPEAREGDVIKDPAKAEDDAEREAAEKEMAIQKLVEGKEFYLPINQVEKRRTKRVVAAGIILSLVLIMAWVNLSLDAELLEIPGVQPVTHFF